MTEDDHSTWHIGRSWREHRLEDLCPCPKERCGLVQRDRIDPDCPQHSAAAAQTIRQTHSAADCPGEKKKVKLRKIEFELGHTVGKAGEEGAPETFSYAPILFVRQVGEAHSLVALNRADWLDLGQPERITVTVEEI